MCIWKYCVYINLHVSVSFFEECWCYQIQIQMLDVFILFYFIFIFPFIFSSFYFDFILLFSGCVYFKIGTSNFEYLLEWV
jgi:hypothetical protein